MEWINDAAKKNESQYCMACLYIIVKKKLKA